MESVASRANSFRAARAGLEARDACLVFLFGPAAAELFCACAERAASPPQPESSNEPTAARSTINSLCRSILASCRQHRTGKLARAGPKAKLLYGRDLDDEEIVGLRGPAYTL